MPQSRLTMRTTNSTKLGLWMMLLMMMMIATYHPVNAKFLDLLMTPPRDAAPKEKKKKLISTSSSKPATTILQTVKSRTLRRRLEGKLYKWDDIGNILKFKGKFQKVLGRPVYPNKANPKNKFGDDSKHTVYANKAKNMNKGPTRKDFPLPIPPTPPPPAPAAPKAPTAPAPAPTAPKAPTAAAPTAPKAPTAAAPTPKAPTAAAPTPKAAVLSEKTVDYTDVVGDTLAAVNAGLGSPGSGGPLGTQRGGVHRLAQAETVTSTSAGLGSSGSGGAVGKQGNGLGAGAGGSNNAGGVGNSDNAAAAATAPEAEAGNGNGFGNGNGNGNNGNGSGNDEEEIMKCYRLTHGEAMAGLNLPQHYVECFYVEIPTHGNDESCHLDCFTTGDDGNIDVGASGEFINVYLEEVPALSDQPGTSYEQVTVENLNGVDGFIWVYADEEPTEYSVQCNVQCGKRRT